MVIKTITCLIKEIVNNNIFNKLIKITDLGKI